MKISIGLFAKNQSNLGKFELETPQAHRILIITEADVLLAFLRSRHHLIANASLLVIGEPSQITFAFFGI